MLPELTGEEIVDRLAVIISHEGGEQLLGVPKLQSSSGSEIAGAVYKLLIDWNIADAIAGASFDTTACNSGRLRGAAVLLEQKLGRSLLYLPCRHHICELSLRAAFESKTGKTTGVNVPLFAKFKGLWKNMDKNKFKSGVQDRYVATHLKNVKKEVVDFCKVELAKKHARSDYLELLELTLIYLGENLEGHNRFRVPGPMHHARWMSKAIYTLKIFIFRDEFKLTVQEHKSLCDISIFIVRFYVKLWFRSTIAAEAPYQDITYLREMQKYKQVDKVLSVAVIDKITNHLWYVADESIALAFFDTNVSNEQKQNMAMEVIAFGFDDGDDEDDLVEPCKRMQLNKKDVPAFLRKQLSDFITPNTYKFFHRFGISKEFLFEDPSDWSENEDFQNGLAIIRSIRVANDTAERGIKLMKDFNRKITIKEDGLQNLLQVAKDYTGKFPFHTKRSLAGSK